MAERDISDLDDKAFVRLRRKKNKIITLMYSVVMIIFIASMLSYLNKDCLKDIVKYYVDKHSFVTKDNHVYTNSQIIKEEIKKREKTRNKIYKELSFYGTNPEFTKIQEDPRVLISYLTFAIFFTNSYEEKLQRSDSYSKISNLRKELYFLIKNMTPSLNIGNDNIRDIKKEIEKQKHSYKKIIEKKDSLLEEYSYLETIKKIQSFKQEDKNLKIQSEFIYASKEELYKETSLEKPSKILEKIEKRLKDEKLKELLKIYENIKVEDDLAYVVSCMNIVYLLSAPRINIDEESSKTNIFKKELNHIYEFMINLTDNKIALSDEKKDKLIEEYQVSQIYFEMQIKLLSYAYLEDKELQNKAKSFLKKYEKKQTKSYFVKLEDINDHLYDEEFKTKALIETMTQTLYTINGFSSNVVDILEKMKGEYQDKTKIPDSLKNFLDKIIEKRNLIKSTSTLIAFITLGLYIYNKDKNFSNTMSAVLDIVNLTKATTQVILKEVQVTKSAKDAEKILQKVFQDQRIQNISKTASKIAIKVGIPLIVITGTYEAVKLFVNEDYDASIVSTIKTSLSIYLLISVPLISYIALFILEVIWAYFSHYVINSSIEKYLIKSLLYHDVPFLEISYQRRSIWGKIYQAPYLFETTNQNKDLEAISSDGFNSSKKLVNFIGENYKGNEQYFDTSLKNELSFFKSSLFGYKLEKTEFQSHQRVRVMNGSEINFYVKKALKIPKILAEDKEFKFFFSPYREGYWEFQLAHLVKENEYYIFDFFPEENGYIYLNQFTNKIKRQNHKSYIAILSSQIELKYKIEFRDNNKTTPDCYIDIASLEQISFSVEDEELLKGTK